jgi:Leucine-rich repeat (LRR) protein
MLFSKSPEQKLKAIITWVRSLKINVSQNTDDIKNISRLDLSFKGLTKLPEEIGSLESLTELNLSNNNLKQLPKGFRDMKALRSLNLGYNRFTTIPDVIFEMQQLEVLNMQANLIKNLPSSIGKLANLSTLNLFANQISEVSPEFCTLRNLSRLNMALNQLSKLPAAFENLTQIVELELWLNKFELIPEVVSKLPNLPDLYNSFDTDKLNKALIMAVYSDNIPLAEKLIFNGADVNYEMEGFGSQLFTTPLFEIKSIQMINLLLSNGADPHLKREITKYVLSKDGEEKIKKIGKFESFLTIRYPGKLNKYIKSLNIAAAEEK